ncbi:hypothetical protein U5801_13060 [Lamprobacter modestohalophilus]|uniref:hypothetical protein n=1 Tax=Lamprobacter modestohalophilus TaxID=1064514 RepID=UPI002ADEC684|nr:hypothetical protein [Lamprobacter modestohalophilus]MEA1050730.1 hypothetical protein [Lamprobacter modestohalophilus]
MTCSRRCAQALSPRPPDAPSARNPQPDQAVLAVWIFAYLTVAAWLLVRRRPAAS